MILPDIEAFKSAQERISELLKPFDSMKSVDGFLKDAKLNKDPIKRFLAYLLKLNVISLDSDSNSLQIIDMIPNYFQISKEIFGENYETPLEKINKADKFTIEGDIKRCYILLVNYCKHFGISDFKQYPEGKLIPERILAAIAILHPDLAYLQGYDRFLLISYSLSLKFCEKIGIESIYAEAFAYNLALSLITNADLRKIIENPGTYEGFDILEDKVQKYCPNTYKILSKGNIPAFTYSMRWRLLFFSDEHEVNGTLLIWDNMLLRMSDLEYYFGCIGAAHVLQVEIKDDFSAVEKIQKFRDWDVVKIVNDADLIEDGKDLPASSNGRKIVIAVSILALAAASVYAYSKGRNVVHKLPKV